MNRLISIIISLSLLCTCFVCNMSVGASEDVPTEYGTIPSEYADATQYPIVVFKKDGTFLKAPTIFADNTANCAMYWIRSDNSGNQGKYILLREDITVGTYPNINYHYNQENIIDLGGNTLTLTSTYLFGVIQRFARDVNITFRNGTIVYPDKVITYGDNASWTGGARFNFTFEKITFRLSDNSTTVSAIVSGNAGADTVAGDILFDTCTFDLANKDSATDTKLFNIDLPAVENNITVKGGKIVASDCDSLKIVADNSDASSVVFAPNDNGEYTSLVLSASASGCSEIIPADGGDASYVVADDDGEYATYILKADFIHISDVIINRVEFLESDGNKSVRAVVRNMTDSEKTVVMIAVSYDENNVISNVASYEESVVTVSPIELPLDADAQNYAVFFVDSFNNPKAFDGVMYTSDSEWYPEVSLSKEASGSTYISAGYDVSSETIVINGEGYGKGGDTLCVNVALAEAEMSESNPPVISAMYQWNDNGTVSAVIPVSENVVSGKYNIILSGDGMESVYKTPVIIFRKDSTETTTALNIINDSSNYEDFHNLITTNSFVLGIDYFDEKDWETMTSVMYGVKVADGNFTVDTLSSAADYGRAVSFLKGGELVESVMQTYSSVFQTTYQKYSALSDEVKKILNSLIIDSDFFNGYINYSVLCDIASAVGCKSYEELKTLICSNSERYEVDLNGDYKTLSPNDAGKVFRRMYSERDTFKTIADISKSFYDAVDYYIEEAQNNYSPSGGGSSSGKNPSGGIYLGGGSGTTSITVPAPSVESDVTDNNQPPQPENAKEKYTDIKGHFAYDDIAYLSNLGVIDGYSDNTFRPNENITRAELCKIISVAFDISGKSENAFDDVLPDSWYFDYVGALASKGIVHGYGRGFRPDDTLSRQDCAVILCRVMGYNEETKIEACGFSDSAAIADYAKSAVAILSSKGIMNGDGDAFRPTHTITRGELAAVVARVKKGVQ